VNFADANDAAGRWLRANDPDWKPNGKRLWVEAARAERAGDAARADALRRRAARDRRPNLNCG
jgi:hypothetical protein